MPKWNEVASNPDYIALPDNEKRVVADRFYSKVISTNPSFVSLPDIEKQSVKDRFYSKSGFATAPTPQAQAQAPQQPEDITPWESKVEAIVKPVIGVGKKVAKGAFDTAGFIGAVASLPSEILQGKWKTGFENVRKMGDKAPLEDISNALGLAVLAYGSFEGVKAIPELARLVKNPSLIKSVFGIAPKPGKSLVVSDIPNLRMSNAQLTEFFKKSPEGVQKAMAVHNPQMRKILQTGGIPSPTAPKPVVAPASPIAVAPVPVVAPLAPIAAKPVMPAVKPPVEMPKSITPFTSNTGKHKQEMAPLLGRRVTDEQGTWELTGNNDLGLPYFSKVQGGKVLKKQYVIEGYDQKWVAQELGAQPKPIVEPELVGQDSPPIGLSLQVMRPSTIPKAKQDIQKMIRARYGEIQEGMLDSYLFRTRLKKELTPLEREAIPFIREKTGVPKELMRPDLEKAVKSPSAKLLSKAAEVGKYLDEGHAFLTSNMGRDVGFIEDYIPHIWDIPKGKKSEAVSAFTKLNPHTKERLIPTIKAGIEAGLKPKTLDVERLLAFYDQYKVKAVANIKFADNLVKMTDEAGSPLVQRMDKAPSDWPILDHFAFNRAKMMGEASDMPILMKVPLRVHPDIADEIKVILDKPFDSKAIRALTVVNAFLKKSQLSLSLFHHMALTETGLATPSMFKKSVGLWNPLKMFDAIKNNNYTILEKSEVARDGLRHGLQVGAIEDVQRSIIQKSFEAMEQSTKDIPYIGKLVKGISKTNEVWDKALWDYLHNGLKISAYEGLVEWSVKKFPNKDIDKLKDEVGQFVNDTYGGQAWELLMKDPKWRQSMHLILLSPDWTYSTVRQALSPLGIGRVHPETREVRQAMGSGFWARAVLYFWGSVNLFNYALTKGHDDEGKWMWENDPGHRTHLFIGYNKDGSKRYLRWGKQFRELPEALANPVRKLSGKLAPIIQATTVQLTGHTTGGWKTPIADKGFYDGMPDRIKELLKAPIPFSFKQAIGNGEFQPLGIAMPISKGMTPYTTRQHFTEALNIGSVDGVVEAGRAAIENKLDARSLLTWTVAKMKADRKYELRKAHKVASWKLVPREAQIEYINYEKQLNFIVQKAVIDIFNRKAKPVKKESGYQQNSYIKSILK